MNKHIILITALISIILTSCNAPKQVAYFQYDSGTTTQSQKHEIRIKPKDILSITVVASNNEATKNFNLITPQTSNIQTNTLYTQPTLQPYLVEDDGSIDFPTLGKLTVAGLTRSDLEKMIFEKIKDNFSQEMPIITISITNFSVSVLGEVTRPGKFTVPNERITILDAISQAGDLTLYGKRENVKVLRENSNGEKQFISLNLNDQNIINSPAFYLEQNDIVYIEPNDVRKRTAGIGTAETLSISVVSALISIASLIVNIIN